MANPGKGPSGGAEEAAKNAAEQAKKVAPKAAAVTGPPAAATTNEGKQAIESGQMAAANSMPNWLPAGLDGAMVFNLVLLLAFCALIYIVFDAAEDDS